MIVTPFAIEDYSKIELANGVGLEHWGLKRGVLPVLWAMNASGTFWTARKEGEVVCIGGYHQAFEGVCEASFFPSRYFVEHPLGAYRFIKSYVSLWSSSFRRVQLNCRAEGKFIRFAQALGFQEEGRLRKFDHQGRDHMVMAIVR